MIQRIQKRRAEEGFTLIELLIVIIILGILAAIVVFALGNTRRDSVASACKTDFKQIELSAEAVRTKVGEYPATALVWDAGARGRALETLDDRPVSDRNNALVADAETTADPPVRYNNGALLRTYPVGAEYMIQYNQDSISRFTLTVRDENGRLVPGGRSTTAAGCELLP